MAEERILILAVKPFYEDEIAYKDINVNIEDFPSRTEVIERMAKAMYISAWKRRTPLVRVTNWEYGFADNMKKKYLLAAEAALDALIKGE